MKETFLPSKPHYEILDGLEPWAALKLFDEPVRARLMVLPEQ